MEKINMEFICFDTDDVITTSGPFGNEDITNGDLFYFYGLGNNATAPGGLNLLIRNLGQDVTADYWNEESRANVVFADESDMYHLNTSNAEDGYYVEGFTSEQLKSVGIEDGAYEYSSNKGGEYFRPYQQ